MFDKPEMSTNTFCLHLMCLMQYIFGNCEAELYLSLNNLCLHCASYSSPEFSLLVEPPTGNAEHLIAEILLPGVVSNGGLVLDYVQAHVNTLYKILDFDCVPH